MSATFSRWAYAKYGPKTFGLGESGDGAFFKITCIYGAADDEEPRAAMNFIREARLVSHQTGKSPSELAASLADAQAEIARLRGALEKTEQRCEHLRSALSDIAGGEITRSHCVGPHCVEELGVATADEMSSRAAGALDWDDRTK